MVFASWLSDQFFGGIGWLLIFAGALHLLFNKYGGAISPTVRKEAGDAMLRDLHRLRRYRSAAAELGPEIANALPVGSTGERAISALGSVDEITNRGAKDPQHPQHLVHTRGGVGAKSRTATGW